jgi:hypothetical protein
LYWAKAVLDGTEVLLGSRESAAASARLVELVNKMKDFGCPVNKILDKVKALRLPLRRGTEPTTP